MKARVIAGLAVFAVSACGAGSPTTPGAATLTTLAISGMPASLWADERVSLGAQATYSDGRIESATTRVRWATRTLACLVDAGGVLIGAAEGDCTVEASLDGVISTASVPVGAARYFAAAGRVREEYGIGHPPMPRVSVTVVTGPQAGRRVETGADGAFVIADLPRESVQLRIGAEGYASMTATSAPGAAPLDVMLGPVMVVEERAVAYRPDESFWIDIPLRVTHRGPFTLRLTANAQQCEVSYHTVFSAVLLRAGVQLASVCPYWNTSGTQPPALVEHRRILDPGDYMVRIFSGGCCKEQDRRAYLSYPR